MLYSFYTNKAIYPSVTLSTNWTRKKSTYKQKNTCTDLVIWGKILYSSFSQRKLSHIELNMIKLPQYQRDILIGVLLSDGWLSYASVKHKSPRLGFEQTFSKSSYVWSVYWALSHYCYSLPKYIIRVRNALQTSSVSFATRSLPRFVEFYNLFYLNGKKVLPENIYHLLTPIALAHLIMGDGSAKSHGLIICTDSYSVFEVIRLMNVLMIRYRLDCRLRNHGPNQPRIYISKHSMDQLRRIVQPFMHSSMLYKIDLRHYSSSVYV